MAVDTAKKRKAASEEQDPQPDGTIDASDRAQIGGVYLQAGGVTVDVGDFQIQIIISDRRRRRS